MVLRPLTLFFLTMFVKLTNGQPSKYPYTIGELRQDNPTTSFPNAVDDDTLALYEVYRVTEAPAPFVDNKTHRVTQWVELINGSWTQTWQIQRLPEHQASDNVRAARNRLLTESDWTQLPDTPFGPEEKAAWAFYRENLRMIPEQAGFPWDVQWPPQPNIN